jgi:ketosteroid isomerase-like protein
VSRENVQRVRQAYEQAVKEQSLEPFLELLDPEIVWDNRAVWPDGARFQGVDAVLKEARRWFGTWEEYRFTPVEFIDAGDCVLVPLRVRGRGKGSGADVEKEFVEAWRLRGGKAIEHYAYPDEAAAFEGLGIVPQGDPHDGPDDAVEAAESQS